MRVTWVAVSAALVGCALSRDGLFESETAGSGGGATAAQTQASVGGSTTATSSTATGQAGSENCLDGMDNDNDMLVDCADDACTAGFECVPAAPTGWQHARLLTGDYGALTAQPCPDASAPAITFHETGENAECTACECGSIQGVTCSAAQLRCYTATSCSGQFGTVNASTTGCKANASAAYLRCEMFAQPQASGGSCPATGGVPTVPAPFAFENHACQVADVGAGCESDEVCVPRGAAPYDAPVCIAQDGEASSCPSGWSGLTVTYETFTDDRGCNACGCSVSGASCNGAFFTVYDLDSCIPGGDGTLPVTGSCEDVAIYFDNGTGSVAYDAPTPDGNCSPQGGEPNGSIAPGTPTSYCCQ